MTILSALSIDHELIKGLAISPVEGSVHSVFKRALNIESKKGRIITVAVNGCPNGPDTIIADCRDISLLNIRPGMRTSVSDRNLFIDASVIINLRDAKYWNGNMEGDRSSGCRPFAISLIDTVLDKYSAHSDSWEETEVLRIAEKRSGLQEKIEELNGMGPGLTPAGDDFIMGMISCGTFLGYDPGVLRCPYNSTLLSNNMIRNALSSRFPETITDLYDAVREKDMEKAARSALRLLDTGATSGYFTLKGILWGFKNAHKYN